MTRVLDGKLYLAKLSQNASDPRNYGTLGNGSKGK